MATRKKYTREFKQDAVRLVTEQGYNQSEAARNLARIIHKKGRTSFNPLIKWVLRQ